MRRVVIADDEPDIRLLVTLQLTSLGFEVVGEAATGRAAIAICLATEPDCLVLDLLMPDLTGFEVIPVLREAQPDLRIVAYSAVAGDFVRQRMDELGVPLLLKSGDGERLAEVLLHDPHASGSPASPTTSAGDAARRAPSRPHEPGRTSFT